MPLKFENLKVWQRSLEYSFAIHTVTLKFPQEELFILTSQIKRAADSIALNIAEGSTGQTNPEFKRFLTIAMRSGIEVIACLYLAKRRTILSEGDFETLYNEAQEIIRMIHGLKKSLK